MGLLIPLVVGSGDLTRLEDRGLFGQRSYRPESGLLQVRSLEDGSLQKG